MKSFSDRWGAIKSPPYLLMGLIAGLALAGVVLFQTLVPAQAHSAMIKINKVSSVDGSLLPGATFRIDPNPYFCFSNISGTPFEALPR